MPRRILIQCSTPVARNAVRRETIDGVEHVIISSKTLPDDIVMNGGLYPADEIAASYQSLERTLAPVEHPTDSKGNFIPATDPTAIHNFYAGAFNENVRRENGRVLVDKVINVAEARKTDRGKRLLDRIHELETNDKARPIHTSVGVYVEAEVLTGPQTNTQGDEYTWVARSMVFDHDAILLDSVGAAQPHQGVGIAVNSDGEEIEVQQALVTIDAESTDEMSHAEIRDALEKAIRQPPINGDWVSDVFGSSFIFWAADMLFQAPYTMSGRTATLTGLPIPVDREVSYTPKTNNQKGDAMRELLLAALAAAKITVNADISDADLLAKYNELLANQNTDGDGNGSGDGKGEGTGAQAAANVADDVITNALKPVLSKLDGLEQKINQKDIEEAKRLAEIVGNSDAYPGIDVEEAGKLPIDTLKKMAANCQTSYGVPLHVNTGGSGESHSYDMPN